MKSRILISMDITDTGICREFLDKPRKYVDLDGLDVNIIHFGQASYYELILENSSEPFKDFDPGYFVGLYEYEGDSVPVDTLVGSLEDYGPVMGVVWCSDGVLGPDYQKLDPEEWVDEDRYVVRDYKGESCGYYLWENNIEGIYESGPHYAKSIYSELWAKEKFWEELGWGFEWVSDNLHVDPTLLEKLKHIKGDC